MPIIIISKYGFPKSKQDKYLSINSSRQLVSPKCHPFFFKSWKIRKLWRCKFWQNLEIWVLFSCIRDYGGIRRFGLTTYSNLFQWFLLCFEHLQLFWKILLLNLLKISSKKTSNAISSIFSPFNLFQSWLWPQSWACAKRIVVAAVLLWILMTLFVCDCRKSLGNNGIAISKFSN
jgi:hypothetical protein